MHKLPEYLNTNDRKIAKLLVKFNATKTNKRKFSYL